VFDLAWTQHLPKRAYGPNANKSRKLASPGVRQVAKRSRKAEGRTFEIDMAPAASANVQVPQPERPVGGEECKSDIGLSSVFQCQSGVCE
jgi:hypothetical protein